MSAWGLLKSVSLGMPLSLGRPAVTTGSYPKYGSVWIVSKGDVPIGDKRQSSR